MTPQVGTACQDGTGGPGDRETARGGVRTAARPLELRQWATWLRLNAPRQARGAFRRRQRDGTMHVCAIGALEEIGAGEAPILFCPLNEATFIRKVRVMNDSHGWTFPQIADWLDGIADGTISLGSALGIRVATDMPRRGPAGGRGGGKRRGEEAGK